MPDGVKLEQVRAFALFLGPGHWHCTLGLVDESGSVQSLGAARPSDQIAQSFIRPQNKQRTTKTNTTIIRESATMYEITKGLGSDLTRSQEDYFARQDQLQHAVASFNALVVLL